MDLTETQLLADTIQSLNTLQLFVFVSVIAQLGFIVVLTLIIKNKNTESKYDSEASKNTFIMMSQIYNSFSNVTESFKREQEKDWQRTQQFFKAFNELFKIQKQIYYVIGRLEKRVEIIEQLIGENQNGQK